MVDPLETRVAAIERRIEEREKERQDQERRYMRSALIFLGTVIVVMGGFIWSEIIWPVIKGGRS